MGRGGGMILQHIHVYMFKSTSWLCRHTCKPFTTYIRILNAGLGIVYHVYFLYKEMLWDLRFTILLSRPVTKLSYSKIMKIGLQTPFHHTFLLHFITNFHLHNTSVTKRKEQKITQQSLYPSCINGFIIYGTCKEKYPPSQGGLVQAAWTWAALLQSRSWLSLVCVCWLPFPFMFGFSTD